MISLGTSSPPAMVSTQYLQRDSLAVMVRSGYKWKPRRHRTSPRIHKRPWTQRKIKRHKTKPMRTKTVCRRHHCLQHSIVRRWGSPQWRPWQIGWMRSKTENEIFDKYLFFSFFSFFFFSKTMFYRTRGVHINHYTTKVAVIATPRNF